MCKKRKELNRLNLNFGYLKTNEHVIEIKINCHFTCKTLFCKPVFSLNSFKSFESGFWFIWKWAFIILNCWCLKEVRIRFFLLLELFELLRFLLFVFWSGYIWFEFCFVLKLFVLFIKVEADVGLEIDDVLDRTDKGDEVADDVDEHEEDDNDDILKFWSNRIESGLCSFWLLLFKSGACNFRDSS